MRLSLVTLHFRTNLNTFCFDFRLRMDWLA